jgi:hypothetical protein
MSAARCALEAEGYARSLHDRDGAHARARTAAANRR